MRIFKIEPDSVTESADLEQLRQAGLPGHGYIWISCTRHWLEGAQAQIQATLQTLCGTALVDLHVTDLLNPQLPSHYDYTSRYDLLIFRRLAAASSTDTGTMDTVPPGRTGGPPILRRIDTSPVSFVVFGRVLLTVHPADCAVRDSYVHRLLLSTSAESRAAGVRLPTGPADLMLRIVNHMVDGYLALRRELTRQLDHWQSELLSPRGRFTNWAALLDARIALHHLDEICEEQRSCIQDWIEAVKTWPDTQNATEERERELLQIRSRDVLEHIERVIHHVRQLEQNAETAVQMHFNAQGNRTNDIMRTLTAITAIFLPLNLIAAIFGMNFDFIPMLHTHDGFWWAMGSMFLIAVAMALIFWRKRYLARTSQ